jgi:hypothetical protein
MTDYPFNWNKPVKADTIANFCVYTEQNAEHIIRSLFGFVRRPKFIWKDADEIYIDPGCYHHAGSTRDRLVWWNSRITFKFGGAAGSNAASDELGNSEWHYLFIDDSAVNTLASNELTAAEFLNDTTAPTWSDAKHGWYTGNDRCIGAFLTGATANILEFHHDGTDYFQFADNVVELTAETVTNVYEDVDLTTSVPGFCTSANLCFISKYIDVGAYLYCIAKGQTGTTGIQAGAVDIASTLSANTSRVATSSAQVIQIKFDAAGTNQANIKTVGWYFPAGL